jgi:type II secretion system protein N
MATVPRPIGGPPAPARPRWRRWLTGVGAVLGVVGIVTVLTFPTDEILRGLLARVTPPGGPFLVFRHAALRPWGLRLDEPVLRRADGTAILDARWVRVRPSFTGLLHDGTGRPWQLASALCGGTVEGSISADRTAATIDATWTDLDVGACVPSAAIAGLTLAGRVSGHATAHAGGGVPPTGQGELRVRDGLWEREPSDQPELDGLHVDAGALRWSADGERLQLEGLELRGPELALQGGGTIRLTGSPATNVLDLRFTVVPGPEIPEPLARMLDRLPPAPGADPLARTLVVKGTVNAPQIVTR